jgi:Mg2+-importing ATPase
VLSAGDIVPGDAAILESKDLFVQEAALTGESFPTEKEAGTIASEASLMKRTNTLFMGTHIVSGSARALIIFTGSALNLAKYPSDYV